MKKNLVRLLAAAALCACGVAHAGNVYWSVGISVPAVTTVVSNAPAPIYAPAPAYYEPPVVYAPPRVVYAPAAVVYVPRFARPVPVYYRGWAPPGHEYRGRGHKHGHWHDED